MGKRKEKKRNNGRCWVNKEFNLNIRKSFERDLELFCFLILKCTLTSTAYHERKEAKRKIKKNIGMTC